MRNLPHFLFVFIGVLPRATLNKDLGRVCWKTQNNNISVLCTFGGFMGEGNFYTYYAALPLIKMQRTDNICSWWIASGTKVQRTAILKLNNLVLEIWWSMCNVFFSRPYVGTDFWRASKRRKIFSNKKWNADDADQTDSRYWNPWKSAKSALSVCYK